MVLLHKGVPGAGPNTGSVAGLWQLRLIMARSSRWEGIRQSLYPARLLPVANANACDHVRLVGVPTAQPVPLMPSTHFCHIRPVDCWFTVPLPLSTKSPTGVSRA